MVVQSTQSDHHSDYQRPDQLSGPNPMKDKLFHKLTIALALLLAGTSMEGQEAIQYRFTEMGRRPTESTNRPDTRFRAAEAALSRGTFDAAAEQLLRGAEAHTKSIFAVPSLRFQRAVTQSIPSGRQRGDVLIAEWNFQEAFGKGAIVLTDTPYYSNYEVRLSDCKIGSQADLTTFLGAVLRPGKGPVDPSTRPTPPGGMTVYLPLDSSAITLFRGSRPSISPYLFIADFTFSGLLENEEWFIDFGIGKAGTSSFYPVPLYIPERFPPLGDLIKPWSFRQIRSSVGEPVKPWEGGADFTDRRDRILIAELARRVLSQDQVIDLLRDVEPTANGYASRLGAVSGGFQDAGKEPFEQLFFKPALELYESIGYLANQSVQMMFSQAANLGCSADYETEAIEALRKGTFPEGGFAYLGRCSTSRITFALIETMRMPSQELENQRQFTLKQISRHIEYQIKSLKKNLRN